MTILYGGRNEGVGGFSTGTWKYDGNSWTEVTSGTPGNRVGFAMTIDELRGTVVLYGGTNVAGNTVWYPETWEYVCAPTPAATFARFGTGCGGSGGPPPLLNSRVLPQLGTTFTLDYTGPNGVSPVSDDRPYFMIGFTPLSAPIPMITPLQPAGCTLYVDALSVLPMPLNGTRYQSTMSIPIPNVQSMAGMQFFGQVATLYRRTSAGSGTFVRFTNRADMTIGL